MANRGTQASLEETCAAVVSAVRVRDVAALSQIEAGLRTRLQPSRGDRYELGVRDALVAVLQSARAHSRPTSAGLLERGSMAARLLLLIDDQANIPNRELAELLGTDQTQLSRAGRRLRDLELADRRRHGRKNEWFLTTAGTLAATKLRGRER